MPGLPIPFLHRRTSTVAPVVPILTAASSAFALRATITVTPPAVVTITAPRTFTMRTAVTVIAPVRSTLALRFTMFTREFAPIYPAGFTQRVFDMATSTPTPHPPSRTVTSNLTPRFYQSLARRRPR